VRRKKNKADTPKDAGLAARHLGLVPGREGGTVPATDLRRIV